MPWLLLLHISALVCWCGSLLYLPALINSFPTRTDSLDQTLIEQGQPSSMPRMVFTLIATPAALVAIASGTAVFIANGIIEFWLIAKLTLVSALVVCHTLAGLLVLRAEKGRHQHLSALCLALAIVLSMLITSIIWIVLAKPLQEV